MTDGHVATIADFRAQGALDAQKCAGIFQDLCIEASPARRIEPRVWLDVHHGEIVPKRLDTLRRLGATDDELSTYIGSLDAALKTALSRFHNTIPGFRP